GVAGAYDSPARYVRLAGSAGAAGHAAAIRPGDCLSRGEPQPYPYERGAPGSVSDRGAAVGAHGAVVDARFARTDWGLRRHCVGAGGSGGRLRFEPQPVFLRLSRVVYRFVAAPYGIRPDTARLC